MITRYTLENTFHELEYNSKHNKHYFSCFIGRDRIRIPITLKYFNTLMTYYGFKEAEDKV